MTEAAGNVWPDRAQPYLISVHDPYCLASIHSLWKQTLTAASLQHVLRESMHLPMATPLTDLSVEKRDSSGRALVLRVVAGATWDVDANEFRYALDRLLGWEQIKSNLYAIQRRGDLWMFTGHGLGHGVGLCQAGAEQMARMGSSTEHILSTYFPGTEIASQFSEDADPIASSEHFELVYPLLPGTLGEANARCLGAMAEGARRACGGPASACARGNLGQCGETLPALRENRDGWRPERWPIDRPATTRPAGAKTYPEPNRPARIDRTLLCIGSVPKAYRGGLKKDRCSICREKESKRRPLR